MNLIKSYAGFGAHRTGSIVDQQTTVWLSDLLTDCGAIVRAQPFSFRQYNFSLEAETSGAHLQALPLFYEWAGHIATEKIVRYYLNTQTDEALLNYQLRNITTRKCPANHCKLIVTRSQTGTLTAINRIPKISNGQPTILIGECDADTITNDLQLKLTANTSLGNSHNVIAEFGKNTGNPFVITTPMTGWFSCAGERGTGIALVPELAEFASQFAPVQVIICAGHELGYWGGWHAAQRFHRKPRAILHIGSCVANTGAESSVHPHSALTLTTNLNSSFRNELNRATHKLNVSSIQFPTNPEKRYEWVGESKCWAHLKAPMISLAGESPLFHSPLDFPDRATTESLLGEAFEALKSLIHTLLN